MKKIIKNCLFLNLHLETFQNYIILFLYESFNSTWLLRGYHVALLVDLRTQDGGSVEIWLAISILLPVGSMTTVYQQLIRREAALCPLDLTERDFPLLKKPHWRQTRYFRTNFFVCFKKEKKSAVYLLLVYPNFNERYFSVILKKSPDVLFFLL